MALQESTRRLLHQDADGRGATGRSPHPRVCLSPDPGLARHPRGSGRAVRPWPSPSPQPGGSASPRPAPGPGVSPSPPGGALSVGSPALLCPPSQGPHHGLFSRTHAPRLPPAALAQQTGVGSAWEPARPESLMQIEFDVNRGAGRGERGALRRLARSPTPQPPSDSWLTQGGDGFWGPSGPHTLPEPAAPRPRAEPATRTRSGLGRGRTHGVGAPTATRCRPCCFRRPWLLFKCWGDASGDTPPGHMPNPGCRDG